MIFLSLDLNRKNVKEFLSSLKEIKESKFDGVEICLWEDMFKYASTIAAALKKNKLECNVHNDLMVEQECFDDNKVKLTNNLKFSKLIGARFFITHPIKPYSLNINSSQRLFDSLNEEFIIETVKGIKLKEIELFKKGIALDIGNVIKNGEFDKLNDYKNIKLIHIHDWKSGKDHLPLGKGNIDFTALAPRLQQSHLTIELGNTFRKWSDLKEDYKKSIDFINNLLIKQKSYGRSIRLKHLKRFIKNRHFTTAAEFGCNEGYLLHNISAKKKIGYDLYPQELFNDIIYTRADVTAPMHCTNADLVICSEVIEHVQNDGVVIKNLCAALKKGGFIFLSTINNKVSREKKFLDKARGHLRRYGVELKERLEQEGFTTLDFYPFRSPHYYSIQRDLSKYCIKQDIQKGKTKASGWIYWGIKSK